MTPHQSIRHAGREWLVALLSYALLVAPFGCAIESSLLPPGNNANDNTPQTGLFVNPDKSDALMIAARNAAGDAFFLYGSWNGDTIGEVDSILVRTADGDESYILFESGRPVYLKSATGDYVRITYNEVSTTQLDATVEVYDAGSDTTETVPVEIDLLMAAAQIAQTIESLTGQSVDVPEAPTLPAGKMDQRSAINLILGLTLAPVLAILGQTLVVITGQIMQAVFAAVGTAIQAAVVAAFTPVFLFASLLDDTLVQIEAEPLLEIFIELPRMPTIDVEFGT